MIHTQQTGLKSLTSTGNVKIIQPSQRYTQSEWGFCYYGHLSVPYITELVWLWKKGLKHLLVFCRWCQFRILFLQRHTIKHIECLRSAGRMTRQRTLPDQLKLPSTDLPWQSTRWVPMKLTGKWSTNGYMGRYNMVCKHDLCLRKVFSCVKSSKSHKRGSLHYASSY